jgi:hypothetical protein
MTCSREQALKNLAKAKKPGGRPRGSSAATRLKKQMFAVVEQLGGIAWIRDEVASKDPVAFAKIMASLIPKEKYVEKRKYSVVNVNVQFPASKPASKVITNDGDK